MRLPKAIRIVTLSITLWLMILNAVLGHPITSAMFALVACLKFWVMTMPDEGER